MRRLFSLLRLRFGDQAAALGGILLGLLIIGGAVSVAAPIGPVIRVENGTVVELGHMNGRGGNQPSKSVRLRSGETLMLARGDDEDCRIGDKVGVYVNRTIWGRWRSFGDCRR